MKIIGYIFIFIIIYINNTLAHIAFVANLEGNWDLFVADDNCKKIVQLTNTNYDEKTPSWYKNTDIVYSSTNNKLSIINIHTKAIQNIEGSQNLPKITPAFSYDGKNIVFAQFKPYVSVSKNETELIIYNLKKNIRKKIIDQHSIQMWPSLAPDFSLLVYTSIHLVSNCNKIIQELWITDTKRWCSKQLLLTNSLCQQPVWSNDGQSIAFSSDKSGNFDIWVLNIQNMNLQQITENEKLDIYPAWSPDDKKIAFISTRSGIMEIWVKDIKNNNLKKLTPFLTKRVECKDISWSHK